MAEFRTALVCPSLPPLRLDRPCGRPVLGLSGITALSRGLLVAAALALPALGLRLADPDRPPNSGAKQAAAVPIPPPARTAAALPLR